MTEAEKVAKAKELGKAAFHNGKPAIPALDPELMPLLAGGKVGDGILVLKAWSNAWITENLKQPLPED